MPYGSLRDFIARLEAEDRLVRVSAPVSPVLEMTEIQTRLLAEDGPAVRRGLQLAHRWVPVCRND